MKNIILGILGCMIAVYTIVSCLSIYSISTRKNEMENCISQVLKYHLNRYYATGVSDTEVEAFVRQEIRQQLHTASRVSIDVKSCDMVSGVISARKVTGKTALQPHMPQLSVSGSLHVFLWLSVFLFYSYLLLLRRIHKMIHIRASWQEARGRRPTC